jgi:hypothetical protein
VRSRCRGCSRGSFLIRRQWWRLASPRKILPHSLSMAEDDGSPRAPPHQAAAVEGGDGRRLAHSSTRRQWWSQKEGASQRDAADEGGGPSRVRKSSTGFGWSSGWRRGVAGRRSGAGDGVLTVRYQHGVVVAQAVSCKVPSTPKSEESATASRTILAHYTYESEELGFIWEILRKFYF